MRKLFALPCLLLAVGALAQQIPTAPIPSSPYELVTGPVKLLDETDQRATVLSLIERARQNHDLHAPGGHPYLMKVSFEASGNVSYTGTGSLEELWYAPGQWRWTARLGSYSQTRINLKGRLFDEVIAPMPLRMQMVRSTIFWPVLMTPGAALRIAAGTWKASPVMCVLGSRAIGPEQLPPTRRWEETEFCIDTKSGLLQTYSIAPGIYAVYDYSDAVKFHASTLPRTITIFEGTESVLRIRIDSLSDAGELDPKQFTPSPQMAAQGHGTMLGGVSRIAIPGGVSPAGTSREIQPVLVNASVMPDGKVEEAEALPTSDPALAAAALAYVKNQNYAEAGMGRGGQRELFVMVRYSPPAVKATVQPEAR